MTREIAMLECHCALMMHDAEGMATACTGQMLQAVHDLTYLWMRKTPHRTIIDPRTTFDARPIDRATVDLDWVRGKVEDRGWFVWPGYIGSDEANALARQVKELLGSTRDDQMNLYLGDRRLYRAERHAPSLQSFCDDPMLFDIASSFIGKETMINYVMANFLTIDGADRHMSDTRRGVMPNFGSGGGWHKDGAGIPDGELFIGLKALLYLSDVGETNGPFQMLENYTDLVLKPT